MEAEELTQGLENDKTFRATVRFEEKDGKIEQKVAIFPRGANAETRVAPVYCTRHGRVSVTRTSILISLKFKKETETLEMINSAFTELNQIEDWLGTEACRIAVEKAEDNIY